MLPPDDGNAEEAYVLPPDDSAEPEEATLLPLNDSADSVEVTLLQQVLATRQQGITLSQEQRASLDELVRHLQADREDAARIAWESWVVDLQRTGGSEKIDAIVDVALDEAYVRDNDDLEVFAGRLHDLNVSRRQVREHVSDLVALQSLVDGDLSVPVSTIESIVVTGPGRDVVITWRSRRLSRDQIQQHISALSAAAESMVDDDQLMNVDLQNRLQRQQDVLRIMSTISKMLHDAALATVRKIGSP